jgi:hypothetical protein
MSLSSVIKSLQRFIVPFRLNILALAMAVFAAQGMGAFSPAQALGVAGNSPFAPVAEEQPPVIQVAGWHRGGFHHGYGMRPHRVYRHYRGYHHRPVYHHRPRPVYRHYYHHPRPVYRHCVVRPRTIWTPYGYERQYVRICR